METCSFCSENLCSVQPCTLYLNLKWDIVFTSYFSSYIKCNFKYFLQSPLPSALIQMVNTNCVKVILECWFYLQFDSDTLPHCCRPERFINSIAPAIFCCYMATVPQCVDIFESLSIRFYKKCYKKGKCHPDIWQRNNTIFHF